MYWSSSRCFSSRSSAASIAPSATPAFFAAVISSRRRLPRVRCSLAGVDVSIFVCFGVVAFFSVFIFMFKGRTATFAGLVNRLTSLVAGTVATLIAWAALDRKAPKIEDWASLGLVLVAVYFLTRSEKRRAAELSAAR